MSEFQPSQFPRVPLDARTPTLLIVPSGTVPMTADEVAALVDAHVCPCSAGIFGVCKVGSKRDCTAYVVDYAQLWRVAWAFLATGDYAVTMPTYKALVAFWGM